MYIMVINILTKSLAKEVGFKFMFKDINTFCYQI